MFLGNDLQGVGHPDGDQPGEEDGTGGVESGLEGELVIPDSKVTILDEVEDEVLASESLCSVFIETSSSTQYAFFLC